MIADPDLVRALGFLRRLERRVARRIAELPNGFAVFNPELPTVWDVNLLWLEGLPKHVDAAALAALADEVQGAAGLAHRRIRIADEDDGERLSAGFATLGWTEDVHVLMAHRREPDQVPDLRIVRELDVTAHERFLEAGLRASAAELSAEARKQLARLGRVYAEAGARFLGVEEAGDVVAACDLYQEQEVAQIESVLTLDGHRNRGYARALVLRALDEARAAGADLVFLLAEEDDWPKELYTKLGFDRIGRVFLFTTNHGAEAPRSGRTGRPSELQASPSASYSRR